MLCFGSTEMNCVISELYYKGTNLQMTIGNKGGSKISGNGVHMYKGSWGGGGGCFLF